MMEQPIPVERDELSGADDYWLMETVWRLLEHGWVVSMPKITPKDKATVLSARLTSKKGACSIMHNWPIIDLVGGAYHNDGWTPARFANNQTYVTRTSMERMKLHGEKKEGEACPK